jgi:hypothetical protein
VNENENEILWLNLIYVLDLFKEVKFAVNANVSKLL